jgi:hypothetical protein
MGWELVLCSVVFLGSVGLARELVVEFLARDRKQRELERVVADAKSELAKRHDAQRPPEPGQNQQQSRPPLTEEKRLVDEAAEVGARYKADMEDRERHHRQEMSAIHAKLAQARRVVEESGVGDALMDLLRIMRHWPIRATRDDWSLPTGLDGLEIIPATKQEEADFRRASIRWRWKAREYVLRCTEREQFDHSWGAI